MAHLRRRVILADAMDVTGHKLSSWANRYICVYIGSLHAMLLLFL